MTCEQFLADVATHQMRVLRDDGLYRHLEFRAPGTFNQWFGIVTWPNHLCICGDMGTWVFSRTSDMFPFFHAKGKEPRINAGYWSEKCISVDNAQMKEWDFGAFKNAVIDKLDNYDLAPGQRADVLNALEREVFCEDNQYRAIDALLCFQSHGVEFDSENTNCGMVWTVRFLWCLHAIVWGIQQYDAAKKEHV